MSRPTFLDLFCGAGGLSHGLCDAGWTPLLGLDHWPDAITTYRDNFPGHQSLCIDIAEASGSHLYDQMGARPDWIVGGPPCQGFSTVGKRQRKDPRNALVRQFARVVGELRPRNFLIENVIGLRDMKFVGEIVRLMSDLDYQVVSVVLTAADYGIPQLRRRIFFVGDAEGRSFLAPPPTGDSPTVWDAIGDLPELSAGEVATEYSEPPQTEYQRLLRRRSKTLQGHVASKHPPHLIEIIRHIPDGGNRTSIPNHLQPKSGFHNSYARLNSRGPAVAVTQNMGKPSATRCIHPFQHRGLTAREGARLQGFPDDFHFAAGITSQRIQIGNAVSPILAAVLAEVFMNPASWTYDHDRAEAHNA